jgi:hypothetical protein
MANIWGARRVGGYYDRRTGVTECVYDLEPQATAGHRHLEGACH